MNQKWLNYLTVLCALFHLLNNTNLIAQDFWQQSDDPYGGIVYEFNEDNDGFLYSATYMGVFRSSDNGISWIGVNSGRPQNGRRPAAALDFALDRNGYLYIAESINGIHRAIDNGENWYPVSTGLPIGTIFSLLN